MGWQWLVSGLRMQDFKHIRAWQRAHALAIALHKLARGFTRQGYANLRSQLTRAADSIGATIIEGCGAATNKEFARYLDMSIKSANETEGHLLSARDLELVPFNIWQKYSDETVEIRKMIFGYRKKVLSSPRSES
jgi:four helix bundle protein